MTDFNSILSGLPFTPVTYTLIVLVQVLLHGSFFLTTPSNLFFSTFSFYIAAGDITLFHCILLSFRFRMVSLVAFVIISFRSCVNFLKTYFYSKSCLLLCSPSRSVVLKVSELSGELAELSSGSGLGDADSDWMERGF